jgi:hypothetical protein
VLVVTWERHINGVLAVGICGIVLLAGWAGGCKSTMVEPMTGTGGTGKGGGTAGTTGAAGTSAGAAGTANNGDAGGGGGMSGSGGATGGSGPGGTAGGGAGGTGETDAGLDPSVCCSSSESGASRCSSDGKEILRCYAQSPGTDSQKACPRFDPPIYAYVWWPSGTCANGCTTEPPVIDGGASGSGGAGGGGGTGAAGGRGGSTAVPTEARCL